MATIVREDEFLYRISTASEWDQLQRSGSTYGGDLDKSTGCFHLSTLPQLGDGIMYELADESNWFPHFYGPSRSFSPLPLDVVIMAEKLTRSNGKTDTSGNL
ncbi:hypothetical protein AKJ16_DCAP21226 [Drosera capensis]